MVWEFARPEPHITEPNDIIATFLRPLFVLINKRFTIFTPQSLFLDYTNFLINKQ